MLEKKTIARPYAQAAFKRAVESDSLVKWSGMLAVLAAIGADPQMQVLLRHPKVGREQIESLVLEVAGDALDEEGRNFATLLVRGGRFSVAPEIFELFEEQRAEAERSINVNITSAYELTAEESERLGQAIGKRLQRNIELTTEVDRSLIGGAVVRAGDHVIDLSVRGRLQALGSWLR